VSTNAPAAAIALGACVACACLVDNPLYQADTSSADTSSAGTSSAGTSSAGTSSAGTSSAGTSSAGTSSAGTGDTSSGDTSSGDTSSGATTGQPIPECAGFSTEWCLQLGTDEQYTRCAFVDLGNRRCNGPEIRYGSTAGGVPTVNPVNDYPAYCGQIGLPSGPGEVVISKGQGDCSAPAGALFWCEGVDEPGPHWCDRGGDWSWKDGTLDDHVCLDDVILAIECQWGV